MKPEILRKLHDRYPQLIRRRFGPGKEEYRGLFRYAEIEEKWKSLSAKRLKNPGGKVESQGLIPVQTAIRALIEDRLHQLETTPQQQKPFRSLMRQLVVQDPNTGGDDPYFELFNIILLGNAAQGNGKSANIPVSLMNLDIGNLLGLNLALSGASIQGGSRKDATPEGIRMADKVLKLISHLVTAAAREAAREGGDFRLTRRGGDELSVLFVNVPKARVEKAEARIQQSVANLVRSLGLGDLLHPKYPDDPDRRGVGIGSAFAEYKPGGYDPFEYFARFDARLDRQVEMQKKRRGEERNGAVRQESGKAGNGLRRFDEKKFTHQPGYERGMLVRMPPERLAGIEKHIDRLYRYIASPELKAQAAPSDGHEGFRWSSLKDRLEANEAITASGLTLPQRDFYWRLFDLVKARDITTRFKRESFAEALESALQSVKEGSAGDGFTIVALEMQNMAGLNHTLAHEGCNRLIAEFTDIAAAHFDEWGLAYRPSGRGDRFYLLLPRQEAPNILKRIQHMAEEIRETVAEDHPSLQKLPNPRYTESGYEGVRLVAAVRQLGVEMMKDNEIPNTRRLLDALDTQFIENKGRQLIFDGAALGLEETIPFDDAPQATQVERLKAREQVVTGKLVR